jgi:cell division septation protein DedD
MAMMMAVLALAGCDAGKTPPPPKVQAAAVTPVAPNATLQWEIQLNTREAISDTSAWLLERSYAPRVITLEGKQQVLLGPYPSREQAEQTLGELQAKLTKAHRFASPAVVERLQ